MKKLLIEIKIATSVNTQMITKQKSLIADTENILVVYIDDPTMHIVNLSQLIQKKALFFNTAKPSRDKKATEERLEASRWFMRFKEKSHLQNIKCGAAASADGEAAGSYLEDPSKIADEGGYIQRQIYTYLQYDSLNNFKPTVETYCSENKFFSKIADEGGYIQRQIHTYLQYYSLNNFKPTVETYCSENKFFKNIMFIENAPSDPRTLMETCKEISVVFMPANTTLILLLIDQTSKSSYYLRSTFCKAIAAIIRSKQSKLKTPWKVFTTLDIVKNIHDSWKEVKISTITRVWGKLISTFMNDFERFKTSLEEVTDVDEIARELELEVEPENVTELLQSHDEILTDKALIFVDEQRKRFTEIKFTPPEDVVNILEMTTKDLYYNDLVDKAAARFGKIDSNFERTSTVCKMLSNITCYTKIFCERKT
uniref:DDE-1 domain-containing protein n=1 Tax=Chlorocebus sabaeus TaxID=60711 RepID=A0A0D9R3W2_CHLSB